MKSLSKQTKSKIILKKHASTSKLSGTVTKWFPFLRTSPRPKCLFSNPEKNLARRERKKVWLSLKWWYRRRRRRRDKKARDEQIDILFGRQCLNSRLTIAVSPIFFTRQTYRRFEGSMVSKQTAHRYTLNAFTFSDVQKWITAPTRPQ